MLGQTEGKSLREIDHPLARLTVQILEMNEFEVPEEVYRTQACTLTAL